MPGPTIWYTHKCCRPLPRTQPTPLSMGTREDGMGLQALLGPRSHYHFKTSLLRLFPGNSRAQWPPRSGRDTCQALRIGWDRGQPCALWSTTTEPLLPSVTSSPALKASQNQVGLSARYLPQLRLCSETQPRTGAGGPREGPGVMPREWRLMRGGSEEPSKWAVLFSSELPIHWG